MYPGKPSRQVLRRAIIRARRLQRSFLRRGHGVALSPLAIVVGCLLGSPLAHANPTGGHVAAGSATIGNGAPGTLNVFQQSQRAVINWQGFSIAAGETVNFVQPSAGSVTLNRVLGNDPSAIFGRLNANGTVMLINPNGIVFGPTARVDVGGLVATTANIRDSDFMAGRYEFTQASPLTHAAIENHGQISIRDSGLAALVAPRVRNAGVIQARLGRVALGAAHTFTLDFHGDGLLSFGAGSAIAEAPAGSGALVTNSGEIRADGGSVLLTARAVKGVVDRVINTDGLISATTVHGDNGRIVLSGGDAGTVVVGGRIDASAASGGQGGTVVATGERVEVAAGTRIDASGRHGGGEIALGSAGLSDPANPFANKSAAVSVAAGAVLNADATEEGRGGNVTLWSTQQTVFNGAISARGGAQGGDGGFAEISSQKNIGLTGDVNLGADKGRTGTLLIDPTDLRITDTAAGGTQNANASDGTVQAGDANQGAGATLNTVSRGLLESLSGNANIVLQATGQITVDAMASGRVDFQTTAGRGVTLQSTQNGGIRFVDANTELRTQGGAITLEALGIGSSLSNIGQLTTNGGAVALRATGDIQLGGAINAGTGTVQAVSTVGSITNAGATAPLLTGSAVTLTAGAHIGATGNAISTHTPQLNLEAGGSIRAASGMTLSSLALNARHLAPGTATYEVSATGLTFQVADGSTVSATQVEQAGLNLTLSSDRSMALGTINLGSGTLQAGSTGGNLTGLAGNLSTAGSVNLWARGSTGSNGALGSNVQAINTAAPTLSATAGSGGAYLANTGALNLSTLSTTGNAVVSTTGMLTVGNVNAGSATLVLASTGGSIVDDGDAATRIDAGGLNLSAAGGIGAPGARLQSNASTLHANAASGDILLNTSAAYSVLGTVVAGNGAIDITAGGNVVLGSLTSSTSSLSNSITVAVTGSGSMIVDSVNAGSSGNVSLSTSNGSIVSSGPGSIQANVLTATAPDSNILLSSSAAHLDLQAPSGSITVTQSGHVSLDNLVAKASGTIAVSGNGDMTVGNVSAAKGTTSLTTSGGAILDDGNSATHLASASVSLSATADVGSSANPLQTQTSGLNISNTGNVYLSNTDETLTSLSVVNRHATPGVANTLQISAPYLSFDVTDNGTQYLLNRIIGVPLTSLTFVGDQTAQIGQIQTASGTVTLAATSGSLFDDGNAQSRITGTSVALVASAGNIGSASNSVQVDTALLSATLRGDLYVDSITDLAALNIHSSHPDTVTSFGMQVKAPSLTFAITDSASGHHVHDLVDISSLSFSFNSDRQITLGQADVGSTGSLTFNTTGNIVDDGDKATRLLASNMALSAGAIGASGVNHLDLSTRSLSLVTTSGGAYIDVPTPAGDQNFTNTLTVGYVAAQGPVHITSHEGDIALDGHIEAPNQAVTLTSQRGSILQQGGLISLDGGSLTLNAAGSIGGPSQEITVLANGATVNAQAGTSIAINSTGSLTLGTLHATSGGTVAINAQGGSLLDDGNAATAVTGSQVTLFAQGAIGTSTAALTVDTPSLSLTAAGEVAVNDIATLTELSLTRLPGSQGTLALTAGAGQSFALSEDAGSHTLTQVSSSTPLAFSFVGQRSVNLGTLNVGAAGTVGVSSASGDIANTGPGSSITAGTVALTAGTAGSIGDSVSSVALHGTTDLTLSAGRHMHVASDTTLSNLALTSTNATTSVGTASEFGITAVGQTFGIIDSGTTQNLDFSGAALGNFSHTNQKNLQVGSLTASGDVTLTTRGGGANSNISSDSGSGVISANRVLLTAASNTIGGGSVGTSGTPMRLNTPTALVTASANVHLDDTQNLTTLGLTLSHGTNTTYTYDVNAPNISSFNVTDGNTQSLGMTVSGAMDFSYSVDRGLSLSTIDAGTSTTGSVNLTSRSAPSGSSPQINRASGTLTGGSISLSAINTNGGVGAGATLSTNTRRLSIASGGNVSVSNATTLTSLSLDARHNTTGISNHTYSISSTGLTFSLSDSIGNPGLTLSNISQSGLDLTVKADRVLTAANVNTGSGGKVHLSSNLVRGAGANAITTGDLTLTGSSVYGSLSHLPLYTVVSTLSSTLAGSLHLSNTGNLTLLNNTTVGSARVASTGALLQGSGGLFTAPDLMLSGGTQVGAAGAGNTVQTNTRRLTIYAGDDIFVNNATDLYGLTLFAEHATLGTQNTVSITADRLAMVLTDNGTGSQYTLSQFTDHSGIDFYLGTDVDLSVGTVDVKSDRSLYLSTGGHLLNDGSSLLKGNLINLSASGSVGAAGSSSTRLQTDARQLTVLTGANAYVDNAQDLASLTLHSVQGVGGVAPVYQITAPALIFDVTDNGTTQINNVTDTTGLNFSLNTLRGQAIDVINVQNTGTVSLTSNADILGSVDLTHRVTAGATTLLATGDGVAFGTVANPLRLSSPQLTLTPTGEIHIESDTHIDRLSISHTTAAVNLGGAQSIVSVPVTGGSPSLLYSATDSVSGMALTSLVDNDGLRFYFAGDKAISLGDINLGTTGTASLSTTSGGFTDDGNTGTHVRAATLFMAGESIGAAGGGNGMAVTANSLTGSASNGGVFLDLHGPTTIGGLSAQGDVSVTNSAGDIALGVIQANGHAVNVDNQGGSILSGNIFNTTTVTLAANGSIGNDAAVLLSAAGGGTTLLIADAQALNGATGSINISGGHGLTIDAVSAAGAITLTSTQNLVVGSIYGGAAVSLNSDQGSILGISNSHLVIGTSVTLAAPFGTGNGIGTINTPLRVSTPELTLRTPGSFHVNDLLDLNFLAIERGNHAGVSSSGPMSVTASNLTFSVTDFGNLTTFTNLTDTTGLNFSYLGIGQIAVDTINVGSSGSVQLLSSQFGGSGHINATSGSALVTAGTATLATSGTAGGIGTSNTPLGLAVNALNANSGTGGMHLTQAGSLNLSNLSTTGNLSVNATAGDLTLGTLSFGSNSTLSLTAGAGSLLAGGGTLTSASSTSAMTLSAANGIGTSAAPILIDASAGNTVSASVTGSGSLHLSSTGTLTGGLTTSVADGATHVTAAGDIRLSAMTSATDALGHDINVTASAGTITVNTVSAGADARLSRVNLSANTGSLVADGGSTITGYDVSLFGATGVGDITQRAIVNGQRVQVASDSGAVYLGTSGPAVLSSVNTHGGLIDISTTHDLMLASATSGGGAITVNGTASNVDLYAGNIQAGTGTVSLASNASGGTVQDDGAALTRIAGSTVTLAGAAGVGTALQSLQTTATTLALSNTTAVNGIHVDDSNTSGVTLSSVTAGGGAIVVNAAGPLTATSVTMTADAPSNDVSLSTSSGNLTVTSVSAGASGTLSLSALDGSLLGPSATLTASTLNLTAGNAIGSTSTAFDATGTMVNAQVVGTGHIHLGSSASLTTGTLTTAQGDITVTSVGNLRASGTVSAGQSGDVSLTSTGGNVTLDQAHTNSGPAASHSRLTVQGAQITLNGGTYATTGAQRYSGNVTLGANTVLTGSAITLNQGVDATAAGAQSLTLNGNAVLGSVGVTQALSMLTVGGTTTLDGPAVVSTGNQSYAGAFTANGDATLASSGGSLVFGSTLSGPLAHTLTLRADAGDVDVAGALTVGSLHQTAGGGISRFRSTVTAQNDLKFTGHSFSFDQAVTTTQGGFSIANSHAAGTVGFSAGSTVQAATGFIQTGGSAVYLPATVRVARGPIRLEAPAYLRAGLASIDTDGDITMSGLLGPASVLTLNAGRTGRLAIGLNDSRADHKFTVANLGVRTAGSASLYGSIGGQGGALAASRVNSALANAPYFFNDTPWRPVGTIAAVAALTAPKSVVPTTPGLTSLFNRDVQASNLAPDALSVFTDPAVLTVQGYGPSPAPLVQNPPAAQAREKPGQ
ncbi:MAG: filamentous hemagglutinin N-terminal domain-containing protein [Pseudomonadota bacterium]